MAGAAEQSSHIGGLSSCSHTVPWGRISKRSLTTYGSHLTSEKMCCASHTPPSPARTSTSLNVTPSCKLIRQSGCGT